MGMRFRRVTSVKVACQWITVQLITASTLNLQFFRQVHSWVHKITYTGASLTLVLAFCPVVSEVEVLIACWLLVYVVC